MRVAIITLTRRGVQAGRRKWRGIGAPLFTVVALGIAISQSQASEALPLFSHQRHSGEYCWDCHIEGTKITYEHICRSCHLGTATGFPTAVDRPTGPPFLMFPTGGSGPKFFHSEHLDLFGARPTPGSGESVVCDNCHQGAFDHVNYGNACESCHNGASATTPMGNRPAAFVTRVSEAARHATGKARPFLHSVHLELKGVGTLTGDVARLNCLDCHETPITFEAACKACHLPGILSSANFLLGDIPSTTEADRPFLHSVHLDAKGVVTLRHNVNRLDCINCHGQPITFEAACQTCHAFGSLGTANFLAADVPSLSSYPASTALSAGDRPSGYTALSPGGRP
jgi:hypothetical protein